MPGPGHAFRGRSRHQRYLQGVGRRLREFARQQNRSVTVVSIQPTGPLHGLEGLKHMETAIVPGIYALVGSLRVAEQIGEGVVVTIFCDGGEKYLTQRFWDE